VFELEHTNKGRHVHFRSFELDFCYVSSKCYLFKLHVDCF